MGNQYLEYTCRTNVREDLQVPWLAKRDGNRMAAFVQTCWIVWFRPGRLAAAAVLRAGQDGRGAGRRFYWIVVPIVTVIGIAFLRSATVPRGRWNTGLEELLQSPPEQSYWFPATVLADSWYGMVPLALGTFLTVRLSLGMYRWCMKLGERDANRRRRVDALGFYFAAMGLLQMPLIGGFCLAARVASTLEEPYQRSPVEALAIALLCISYLYFAFTTIGFSVGLRRGWIRGIGVTLIYPPVAMAMSLTVLLWTHWICGFMAMAIHSMLV